MMKVLLCALFALFAVASAQYVTTVFPYSQVPGFVVGPGYQFYEIIVPSGTIKMTINWVDGRISSTTYNGDSIIYLRNRGLAYSGASDYSSDDTPVINIPNPAWGPWSIATRAYSTTAGQNNTYAFSVSFDVVCPTGTAYAPDASATNTCDQGGRNITLETAYTATINSATTPRWQDFCFDNNMRPLPGGYRFWANVTSATSSWTIRIYNRNNGFPGTSSSYYTNGILGGNGISFSGTGAQANSAYVPVPLPGVNCFGVYASSGTNIAISAGLSEIPCPAGTSGLKFTGTSSTSTLTATCPYPIRAPLDSIIYSGVATAGNVTVFGPFNATFAARALVGQLNITAAAPATLYIYIRAGAPPTNQPDNYDSWSSVQTTLTTTVTVNYPTSYMPYYLAIFHNDATASIPFTASIANQGSLIIPCGGSPACNGRGSCNINSGICYGCSGRSYGNACEFISCLNNCSNNGTCNTATGICACNAGLAGADCSRVASASTASFSFFVLFFAMFFAFAAYYQ